ncbi:hypothetical protein BCR33DRAFT_780752 [Rhizoclosmatium globosum]|uniref:Uncharacterized protein n=1 Tax=Rhizoclosmatium globosum TaxID=329046 RepID=A0A1Y2CVJ9_9FUNG|nr:hypothetical protein BCR33DRAFT_780752 [Rhizoclosmatium globosum]|eukprot:ORY50844.1 hypothetical protein BCR33DRAFT_780752 [Rhizoclosmatium globosum]
MHRLVRHFSRTRRRPLSSVSLSAPIEVRPVFLRTTRSLGASGEAAGLLFRVAAVVAAASFLWTRREAAAVASSAASSFSDKDGDGDAVAAVAAADTFAGLVEDSSASIDRIWAAFVSVAASKKELNLVKAAHLSALLERIASSNSPLASSQALYTLQLLISKKLVPTASDVSNVLASTDSSTHATTKSILRILSPVLSSTRQLLFASAMAQNRLRVAEVVLADSYNHQDVDSGQFADL